MNHFPFAIDDLLKVEGGWNLSPLDKGGETYMGISRKFHPAWEGWKTVDSMTGKKPNSVFPSLTPMVKAFYYNEYWLSRSLDKLTDPSIASAALDTIVNHGVGVSLLQQALQLTGAPVAVDGKIGPNTLDALNRSKASTYLPQLFEVRKAYYQKLVKQDPGQAGNLKGWISRISKYRGTLAKTGGGLAILGAAAAALYFWKKKS